jgi:hypothetical protein
LKLRFFATSLRTSRSLLRRGVHVVRNEVHIVSQSDLSHVRHPFRQWESRKRDPSDRHLLPRRRRSGATAWRCKARGRLQRICCTARVGSSEVGSWSIRPRNEPIFLPIHDAKEIGLSCDDVRPPGGRVTVQRNAFSSRNGLLTSGKGIAERAPLGDTVAGPLQLAETENRLSNVDRAMAARMRAGALPRTGNPGCRNRNGSLSGSRIPAYLEGSTPRTVNRNLRKQKWSF